MFQRGLFDNESRKPNWRPPEPPCLDGIDTVFLDCETNGLNYWKGDRPIGIALAVPDGRKWYLPWGHSGGNLSEDTVKRWAQRELRNKHVVNLRTQFDIHHLYAWDVDLEAQGCTVADVGHYAALLDDHRRKFNLNDLGLAYLGEGKVEGLDKNRMAEYHAGDVHEYAEQDVHLARGLHYKLLPMLEKEDLIPVLELENRLLFAVCEMERNAAPIDVPLLERWVIQSEQRLLRLQWELANEVGFQCDPDKVDHMERLFRKLGLPILHYTDAGRASFDDEVLKGYSHPAVQKARYIRKLKSLRSKYLIPYFEAVQFDGRLRYGLHQMRADDGGTVTGRFSSSNHNIQQVATAGKQRMAFGYGEKDDSHDDELCIVRQLFIPETGQWLSADAKQIEYRLFAHYSNSPKILAAYAKDPETDFHTIVMQMIQVIKPDINRKRSKDINFANVFGAGANKIALMLNLPRSEADQITKAYHQAFPECAPLLHKASRTASERGYVKTALGRRSRFPDKKRLHKALNSVIQGTAADINKMKLVELHEARKKTGFKMRFTVHDEVDGDSPDQKCTEMVTNILNRQSMPFSVPILWDVSTGKNWKECK